MAYLKKLMKKVKHQDADEDQIDPDTLITSELIPITFPGTWKQVSFVFAVKGKGKHIESKAKVKAN